jgi:benzoyl-CoA reductase/2-hydroxyglutaryl-CoA dehydratase subunit BcrC/BadD/HgdB
MKSVFEDRYDRPPVVRDGASVKADIDAIGRRYLDAMQARKSRPQAMGYFDDIMVSSRRREELVEYKAGGGKIVGVFCNFVPEELIYASGALPIRLCSEAYPAVPVAEEVLARDVCPLVKSAFGMRKMKLGYFDLCDLAIIPTSCDAKKKCSKFFSTHMPTWTLDLPQAKDYDKNLAQWTREISGIKDRLEEFCGRKITRAGLDGAIRMVHRRTEAFRKLYELRKADPYAISGRDAFLAIQASFHDDIDRWTGKMDALVHELKTRPADPEAKKEQAPKIMLTGAPVIWPNWKLLHTIEEAGAVVTADTLCSGTQRLFDPVEVDEWTYDGMVRALAVKYLFPSICPCFIENAEHIDRILELAADFKADGVVYHTLRLCQLFDMEYNHVAAVLREKGIPLINITTDLGLEDSEQIKTRIEAFLEMIGNRT